MSQTNNHRDRPATCSTSTSLRAPEELQHGRSAYRLTNENNNMSTAAGRAGRLNEYINQGKFLEAMGGFYAHNLGMRENPGPATVGLAASLGEGTTIDPRTRPGHAGLSCA